ncbi:Thermostable carboxypeptidase 1 [Shewanella piezotolerans WP3]|uniref:Metal-dependent carboxypeptidase n=1 Tax=Shewanella piezotolerans (strain WP3 / JCM 13877) TaxID=225849 RepID=B8CU12_SHEPW|nr:carboxypeptidase M32 [Shewanella piezotolerans]ACJ30868.1 Thermostable carboxypeptidase 1 [Shewanella piezotolerans WP3]
MNQPTNKNYQLLCSHFQSISHFEHLSALGDWDQAAMMPIGGGEARGAAMAELAKHIHSLKTAPMLEQTIAAAELEALTAQQQANLREIRYQYQQANIVPGSLVEAKTKAAYKCEQAWREQRSQNDWQGFRPNLENVLALAKEEAQIRAEALNISPYDALLDKFEPGMTSTRLEHIFGGLKSWLPGLIEQIQEKQRHQDRFQIPHASSDAQALLSRDVMTLLQFDFNHGRLDTSSHPFCGGVASDVRLTTRYDEADFTSGLMGVVHETGHAKYEQGLPLKWRGQPAGVARSMAIHESQSLFCEMQLGRGSAFLKQLQPMLQQRLDCNLSHEQLLNIYSRVTPGHIRVDADEVTYPCHILLRFEAEKALVGNQLAVADLPDFWSAQMQSLLGINTDGDYKNGCMQDIHWAVGEMGYFPSYTLGAMYAAQFRVAMEQQLGSMESLVASGHLSSVTGWLEHNIWSKGSLLTTDELVQQATGETLNPEYFKKHLLQRYGA